jgi:glutamate/tyrosine decarboxylase-like PLP-dependent enzyme
MGTTMFGSVDNPEEYTTALEKQQVEYKLHIDGAYGGFVYPFSNEKSTINFSNPKISSITIDAHKMLQAPYGTGIFICRKGLIENVLTKEAEYVEGMDLTLCGSRSGSNAVAVWMILFTYGPFGWFEKVSILQMRTQFLCNELDKLNINYFREPFMNIVTIHAEKIPEKIASAFDLVPQQHNANNKWYKIVLMDHVEVEHLTTFIAQLKATLYAEESITTPL